MDQVRQFQKASPNTDGRFREVRSSDLTLTLASERDSREIALCVQVDLGGIGAFWRSSSVLNCGASAAGNARRSAGERILSEWMNENAFAAWLEHPAPWEIEQQLILELRPSLNVAENRLHSFYSELSQLRRQAKARARSLDVLPNGITL